MTTQGGRVALAFELEVVGATRTRKSPAISVDGDPQGEQAVNDVTTLARDYEHEDVLGGTLSAKGYYQNFSALFGGARVGTSQDPELAPVGELFDQSENNSRKLGTRFTWDAEGVGEAPLDVAPVDFLSFSGGLRRQPTRISEPARPRTCP